MEVHFTPKQEALLSQIASQSGVDTEELVKNAAMRFLEDQLFRRDVEEGIAAARRGDFIEHSEVWEGVENILRS